MIAQLEGAAAALRVDAFAQVDGDVSSHFDGPTGDGDLVGRLTLTSDTGACYEVPVTIPAQWLVDGSGTIVFGTAAGTTADRCEGGRPLPRPDGT